MRPAIMFIDIDGVLNNHAQFPNGYCGIRWKNVRYLNHILKEEPTATLVITSAWRYLILEGSMTIEGFRNLLLSHGVNAYGRDLNHTHSDEDITSRGLQIREWLNEHGGAECYVVIDDGGQHPDGSWYDLDIPRYHNGHTVWINSNKGITEHDTDKIIRIIQQQRGDQ